LLLADDGASVTLYAGKKRFKSKKLELEMKNLMPIQFQVRTRLPPPKQRVSVRTHKLLVRRPATFVSQELLDASYFAGKYITLFVFFYSRVNY
jgi:hypothetical protein